MNAIALHLTLANIELPIVSQNSQFWVNVLLTIIGIIIAILLSPKKKKPQDTHNQNMKGLKMKRAEVTDEKITSLVQAFISSFTERKAFNAFLKNTSITFKDESNQDAEYFKNAIIQMIKIEEDFGKFQYFIITASADNLLVEKWVQSFDEPTKQSHSLNTETRKALASLFITHNVSLSLIKNCMKQLEIPCKESGDPTTLVDAMSLANKAWPVLEKISTVNRPVKNWLQANKNQADSEHKTPERDYSKKILKMHTPVKPRWISIIPKAVTQAQVTEEQALEAFSACGMDKGQHTINERLLVRSVTEAALKGKKGADFLLYLIEVRAHDELYPALKLISKSTLPKELIERLDSQYSPMS